MAACAGPCSGCASLVPVPEGMVAYRTGFELKLQTGGSMGHYDHLHLEVLVGYPDLRAGSHGRMRGIDPLVPHRRYLGEVRHVGKPDRDVSNLALVGTDGSEPIFDRSQDLAGLIRS